MIHLTNLYVKKKTKTPTKNQIKFKYRYDWKEVAIIKNQDLQLLFKYYGGLMETESQFYKFLYDNVGPGIYSMTFSAKKIQGFRAFSYVELSENGFTRIKKKKSSEEKEKEETRAELNRLNKMLNDKDITRDEKEEIQKQKSDLMEDKELTDEIINLDKTKYWVGRFLKVSTPVGKFHGYDDYKPKQQETSSGGTIW